MKKQSRKQHIDGLAALLLFGVFAACVLAVLLTGAGAYQRLVQRDQQSYERRTCTQYIATRVRQADSLGSVTVEQFGGADALRLEDGNGYVTRVYCCDGYLMELYTSEDAELSPEDGSKLIMAESMKLSVEDGLLEIAVVSDDGTEEKLCLSLRSGGEALS